MSTIEEAIVKLDSRLSGVPFEFAFLGGSVLTLFVTDKSADAIRVTKDVDIVMSIRTRKEYHMADSELELRGFRHDTREGAPICRWILDDVTVDVLPIREDVLGWKSRWFEESLAAAETIQIGASLVRIVTPPYFVALKLEAFEERGQKDFLSMEILLDPLIALLCELAVAAYLMILYRFFDIIDLFMMFYPLNFKLSVIPWVHPQFSVWRSGCRQRLHQAWPCRR